MNGNSCNGKHRNGTKIDARVLTYEKPKNSEAPLIDSENHKENQEYQDDKFEQSVVLRQSPVWSRAIMLSMIGLACVGIGWASFAKIEQVVPATGQLKPEGTVKEIQAPVSGVVKKVYVKDGQQVKPDDLLLIFDSTATNAELNSLNKIRAALIQENQVYRRLIDADSTEISEIELLEREKLSREAAFLLKSRAALIAENKLLRTELKNSGSSATDLGIDEQERLQTAKKELDSRSAAAQLEIEQLKKKLAQNQVKLNDAKASLDIEDKIFGKLKTLSEEGAIAELQYLQQQKKVQNLTAQVAELVEEQQRLQFDIEQGQQELKNTVAGSNKKVLAQIADNKKRIAEIDSQLTKIMLDNEKQLADVNSKISQAETNVKYQELRAPVAGVVFDLQAKNSGFVAKGSEELLKIVPSDKFIAEAFITNKDIGFVRKGMKVDVRIDSFPFSEFGDIKGEVISVGSDALPPTETHPYYRFPATIRLNEQSLNVKGKSISLQSGMSISANIKVREERRVISLFTELFTKQIESLKQVR
ncbi:MAG: HlyD family efflux transporter periplasmic adaptor subunit [Fischerella sp.]|jgi:HlyD family secretion protein|uniref:HlyD family efflux transporter periplasmic adaptor subunit n=1 Tax=Fischerella sp. TaxID=1191 RepID=UPI0017D97142|nr:HlyD family efflux transporter periplasmic adaptor subunit [Fischerella sp.]NWF60201.1 HlyD family efflux transporter periplasmic adaptor subunit [Fischerella sp.]